MKRSHPQDRAPQSPRFVGGRDDERRPYRQAQQMGEPSRPGSQFGSGSDYARHDWDGGFRDEQEAHPDRQMGAGDDRFSGDSGSHEPRGGPRDGFRANPWDEERLAYPESHRHERDLNPRGGDTGYGSQGRFGNDWSDHPARYGQSRYGGSAQFGLARFGSRSYGAEFGTGFNSANFDGGGYRSNRFGQQDGSGESFAGGRDEYGSRGREGHTGYGIPAGSEPGGYGFNSPWRRGAQNWSGSNWANDQDWHSRSRTGAFGVGFTTGRSAPKGYTRSDERIKDDVCEWLYRAHDIDVSDVSVEVRSGTVTLEGTVPDRRMKHRIEDLCEQCIGVNDVDNRIRVRREQPRHEQEDLFHRDHRGNASSAPAPDPSSSRSGTGKGAPGSPPGNSH